MSSARGVGHKVGTQLLFEDERVRVWMLDLAPGEATEWHEHEHDYTFVVTDTGEVKCEYASGGYEMQIGDKVGHAEFRVRDEPHRLVNVGSSHYQNVVVELKLSDERVGG